ncbi:hypothetical protein P3T36_004245 [Kitasatospora sp. MAP12-15]|nr:hypothetical protein [Kitasatospora sp. MAP12-44]MDH6108290.1 hypothetical protein [Kitasatospora sp. MAP12-44]
MTLDHGRNGHIGTGAVLTRGGEAETCAERPVWRATEEASA